jgi:signal transduction histidine kinase
MENKPIKNPDEFPQILYQAVQRSPDFCLLLQAVKDSQGKLADFIILDGNPQAAHNLNLPHDLIRGLRVGDIYPGVRQYRSYQAMAECWERQEVLQEDIRAAAEGPLKGQWFHYTLIPNGDVLASFAANITTKKAATERLMQTQEQLDWQNAELARVSRLKSDFIAHMSHELRSPLTGIQGFAEMLAAGLAGPVTPNQKDFLANILQSGQHLLNLVNSLLDQASIEAGKMNFTFSLLDPVSAAREVAQTLSSLAAKKRVQLDLQEPDGVGQVTADPSRFRQVCYNFISNAIKASPKEGTVYVRVLASGPHQYRLEVEDQGAGISPQDQPRLFQQFSRLDAGVESSGTGLGLSACKAIVEAQGGQVGLTSQLGKGSVFYAIFLRNPTTN